MKKIRIHISNFRHLYPVTFLATSLFSVSVTAQLSDTVQTEELFSDDAAVKFIMELKERRGLSTALADLIHNYSLCVREELGQLIERENKGKGKAKGQTKPGLTAFDVCDKELSSVVAALPPGHKEQANQFKRTLEAKHETRKALKAEAKAEKKACLVARKNASKTYRNQLNKEAQAFDELVKILSKEDLALLAEGKPFQTKIPNKIAKDLPDWYFTDDKVKPEKPKPIKC